MLTHVPDDKKQTSEFTVELKLAGEAMDSRSKAKSAASRFFFARQLFFVKLVFFARQLFFVTRLFFVTGTIVPIPIPCADLPVEAGLTLFARRYGRGVVRRRCRMKSCVVSNYW